MGKLLIGCYPFPSMANYGSDHASVISWLDAALKQLEDERSKHLGELENNEFQAIFVSPEYQFTDPTQKGKRAAMDETAKDAVLKALRGISTAYPKILMFPGTVFWKEKLDTEEKLKKFQAQLVAAEIDKRVNLGPDRSSLLGREVRQAPRPMAWVVNQSYAQEGKNIPSLKDLSDIVADGTKPAKEVIVTDKDGKRTSTTFRPLSAMIGTPQSTNWRVYNELYPFVAGNQWTPYRKQWDYKETEGAPASDQAYVPGSFAGTAEIGGFEFGFEICCDHICQGLYDRGKEVDFHIVVSDPIEPKLKNMAMKAGGYFVSASSVPGYTGVWTKIKSPDGERIEKQRLPPPPAPLQSGQMSYWLVDIEHRVPAQASGSKLPKPEPVVTPSGKKLYGAVKVMFQAPQK